MKFRLLFLLLLLGSVFYTALAQDVIITINAAENKKAISPFLFGKNDGFEKPAQFYRDAGVRMVRMNQGNNATKYNWRKKISSHPDWYNNVYANDWDAKSQKASADHPDMQIMWAFQLLGRVASSNLHNFNDWAYNSSQWWGGVVQNLAGGGVPNKDDPWGKALVEGDINLYTEEWPADSTVNILDHWFGEGGLGLDKKQFLYWNMDNEADIWNGTHDDVMKDGLLPASEFMNKYIEVAKKARAKFPEIKICGPVTTSEWQWYKWGEENINVDGKYYCWLEYFIKRCADEETASGIRVLDVFDLHNYPYAPTDSDALQNHRMYYDKDYVYPGANGVKTINGGWDNSQTKEYIFKRIEDWLDKHYGEGHGISLGISEWGPSSENPGICAIAYASTLGVFANNGVEYFIPWNWKEGMWEILHLFSRYAKNYSVSSTSSLEKTVSAYTSVNEGLDSVTVIIVNRGLSSKKSVIVNLSGIKVADGSYTTLQLASLPANETFKSHTENALEEGSISVISNSFEINVPALSTTAVILSPNPGPLSINKNQSGQLKLYPNPASKQLSFSLGSNQEGRLEISVYDTKGQKVKSYTKYYDGYSPLLLNTSTVPPGYYLISVRTRQSVLTKSFILIK